MVTGHGAEGCREPDGERLAVELSEQRAALDARHLRLRVDLDRAHGRQVDHQAAIAAGLPREAVAAATHRRQQCVRGGELHRAPRICGAHAAHDERGLLVERRVPELAGRVVPGLVGGDHLAAHAGTQVIDVAALEGERLAVEPGGVDVGRAGGDCTPAGNGCCG